ncbi:hypothetical protein [Paenibacillus dendritiformis]|uniref:hypothetical protein n=1 Tax=Paenibacillus dendritiformis TaxID=130049 RepID=UPI00387E0F5A
MFHFSKEITDYFMKFLNGGIYIEKFEQWIYDKNFLSELGQDTYEFFISLDFHSLYTEKDITQYILNLYAEKSIDVHQEKINWIVSGMVDGSYDLILGCAALSQLRSFDKRFEYIPILFVGYDSVVEDINHRYNHLIEEEKREMEKLINLYKQDIANLSRDFLNRLRQCGNALDL